MLVTFRLDTVEKKVVWLVLSLKIMQDRTYYVVLVLIRVGE